MAFTLADRVKETTTTAGTGDLTLGGAVNGFLAFSTRLSTGDLTFYAVSLGTQWEVGIGTLTSATNLQRTTVLASSNGDAAVNFASGLKEVFINLPAALASRLSDFAISEATVASAATVDLGAQNSRKIAISGTAAITSFGTFAHGEKLVRFIGACTLTHNATSLILPTGASIVTAAGDTALATSDAAGNWRLRQYQRADGTPLAIGAKGITTSGYQKLPSGLILQWGVVAGSASDQSVTFPTAFPNACFVVVGSTNGNPGGTTMNALVTDGWSTIGFASRPRFASGGTVGISGAQATWIALGW